MVTCPGPPLLNGAAVDGHGPGLARALAHGRRPEVRERRVALLRRLVALPTVSSPARPGGAVDRAAELLRRELDRIGMDRSLVLRDAGAPSVWGEWRRAPGRPVLLFYGHFDVQPAGARAGWRRPPFGGEISGGRIHGRGASDNKGPLVAQLAGLEDWLAATGRLPVNVRVWLEAEEEAGSPHLGRLLDRYGHLLRADGLAVSDSTRLAAGDRPTLTTGLRGLVDLRLRVAGPGRALHSGQLGGEVLDPALVLTRMVSSLWDRRGRIAVPGFYRQVRLPTRRDRTRLASARPGLEALAATAAVGPAELLGEWGWEPGERSTVRPSLTVTGLSAGRTDAGAVNAIATSASARINIRLVPDQRPAEVVALVTRHLRAVAPPRVNYRLEVLASADPVLVPADHPLVSAAARALRATWGQAPAYVRSGGTIPVVAELYRRYRMPAALWGLSRPADRVHSGDESFALADLHRGSEVVARFLQELAP
ncbi:MAG: M20/M25/M40 family metallo-hydrolase [Trebonia sp.]|jgi:acetylornithine deacetylase/succinyl-diaminopimelate desuccinylase-like protein